MGGLHRELRGLGRREGPERETAEAEHRAHVQIRKARRWIVGPGYVPGHITRKPGGNEAESSMWLGLDVKVYLCVPGCFSPPTPESDHGLWMYSLVSKTNVRGSGYFLFYKTF